MHSGRPSSGSGRSKDPSSSGHPPEQIRLHSHTMLSAGASAGPAAGLSLFRGGSLTHGEPRVLAAVGGQYNGAGGGGGASASMGPYAPLFSVHGQSSPLATVAPYPGFFSQYHSTGPPYSPGSLLASARLPPLDSYSAVLATLGTQVQHASPQSQAPSGGRAAYLPLCQYSHRSLSATTSPGPSAHSPSSGTASFALRDRGSLLHQGRGDRDHSPPHHRSALASEASPDDKKILPSSGLLYRGSPGGLLKEVKNEPRDAFQKVPSGKEGSLKHRILTSDIGNPTYGPGKSRSHSVKSEEDSPSSKRARYTAPSSGAASMSSSSSSSSPPTDPHVFVPPHAVGPAPVHASCHYTQQPPPKASHSPSTPSPSSASYLPHQPESGASPESGGGPGLHYPPHFVKGSIIQLANGDLKRVEDLQTEDFVSSAQVSADLKVDSSTVVRIEQHAHMGTATLGFSVGEHRVQVTVEATLEHPFFVFGRGWSSCSPEHTLQRYHLDCHKLSVGDVCISLTHKDVPLKAAEIISQQQQQQQLVESSPKLLESKDPVHEREDHSLKRSPGHKDVSQDRGQMQDDSINGNNTEKTGSKERDDNAVDLTNTHKANRDSASATPNQNSDHFVTSQPSPADGYPSPDTQSSKTRKWSSHESEGINDHGETVKSNSDSNQ